MEFFNRKEEVLDVELTQYGKYLLSIGKLKASYYAFFDDDVIYDIRYQGNAPDDSLVETSPNENQKDSQKRIQETPRIKPQHNFVATDKTVQQIEPSNKDDSLVKIEVKGKKTVEPEEEISFPYPANFKNDYYGVSLPLGTSDYTSIYVPSWQINFMKGQLKSSTRFENANGDGKYGIKQVPQLEVEVTFNTSVGYNNQSDLSNVVVSQESPGSPFSGVNNQIFPNGSFVKIVEDYIIIDVQELNSLIGGEYLNQFDLEIYEIENEGTNKESLRQLNFLDASLSPSVSYPEIENISDFYEEHPNVTPQTVDYFFEVSVDSEIQLVYDYEKQQTNTAVNDLEPCEDDV